MIAIGSDRGGVELKDDLAAGLRSRGTEVRDCGTHGDESVDYPDFSREVSLRVAQGEAERGILICTSGIGMSIAAKSRTVRLRNNFKREARAWPFSNK
jgi:ribose 5-phosphate isomerase B